MANQHVRGFLSKAIIVTVVVAICAASAYAILPGVESIKIAPLSVGLENPKLTGDALATETFAAQQLFDRDTNTAYAPTTSIQVIATLENEKSLHDIKLFGSAPYRLSVDVDQAGSWVSQPGLQDVDLSSLANVWNSFHLSAGGKTARLRFTLLPIASVIDTSERHEAERGARKPAGLSEIEIWGEGTRTNVKDASALLGALQDKTEPPSQGRIYVATPEQGVIGAPANTTDDLTDNTFTVNFPHNPVNFKHIYLVYEANGIAHWVHALRQINGNAAQGGFGLPINEAWSTQREEINPAWLKQGDNTIAFAVPQGATGSYSVRNVRLLGELDIGSNFITLASSNMQEDSSQPQSVLDGDTGTGWKPYGASADDGMPRLTLTFDKPTQVSDLKLYLANQLRGKLQVEFLKDEEHWVPAAQGAIAGKDLTVGWNTIAASSGDVVNGMRLVFSGGSGSSAEIRELVASGSSKGHTWNSNIVASYPDAGQYYGRVAYLRGFLQPMDNGSGMAELSIAGTVLAQTDGAFGVALGKDDIGLQKQGDRTPWSVDIKARYPDGQTVTRTINLTKYADAINAKDTQLPGTYKQVATPGKHQKFEFDGAGLELSGTELDKETTLGIRTLTAKDLARFNQGMTNVTKAGHGYRFTPTPMKFKSKLQVSLPYDQALLPKGKTEKDIKTYYFDPAANRWKELQLASVDKVNKKIVSLSDHFTDMINATVTVPEHPDAVSFNPNSIKDIKAADPGAGINLIEPPKPNNMGDARLSYPIEIPPGRQGLQPGLSVNYNSSGGNGWMGLGWDIPQQSISIDTRWGVPRYSKDKETETYLLDGEQLTPLAHRNELQSRTTNKIFHTRIEGAFRKIKRHGSAPDNYWWEVTDKSGVHYMYGGSLATGLDRGAVLTAAPGGGNIFKWMLKEIRDAHGNNVHYYYDVVNDTKSQPWSQIYLSRINYTGTGNADGPYEVDFLRESGRADVTVDARSGFKTVMDQRLARIDVRLKGAATPLIRRYTFAYNEGAFRKTLLQAVNQLGEDGQTVFNTHTFKYYDEARDNGIYHGFAQSRTTWDAASDLSGSTLIGGKGAPSALGGNASDGTGGSFYFGIGPTGNTSSKIFTGGIKGGYAQSNSQTLLAMADINGDGLPDKVFKSGNGYAYRPNLSGPNGIQRFGDIQPLPSMPGLGEDRSTSNTFSAEEFFANSLHAFNESETESDTYLSDVNGDGITDVVSGGRVFFGKMGATNIPEYTPISAETPVAVGSGSIAAINQSNAAAEAERSKNFPLLDTVRRWVAPFDGKIKIEAPVQLVQDFSDARAKYRTADGVRVAIQLEDTELWYDTIGPQDYGTRSPSKVDSVKVRKGDRLYFRVQSIDDGAYDKVNWSPVITYTDGNTSLVDENLMSPYRYSASKEFVLSGRRNPISVPVKGTVHVVGTLLKDSVTTDGATLLVTRNGNEVMRQVIAYDSTTPVRLNQDIQVEAQDVLEWRLLCDSPVDLTQFRFDKSSGNEFAAYYTEAYGPPRVPSGLGTPVTSTADKKLKVNGDLAAGDRVMIGGRYIGTLHIGGILRVMGTLSGDAVLTVGKNAVEIKRYVIPASGNATLDLSQDIDTKAGDALDLKLKPASPGDLASFSIDAATPLEANYTQAWNPPSTAGLVGDAIPVTNSLNEYTLQLHPLLTADLYPLNDLAAPRDAYVVTTTGTQNFIATLTSSLPNNPATVVVTVKGSGKLLAKQSIDMPASTTDPDTGALVTVSRTISFNIAATKGDKLYFDFNVRSPEAIGRIAHLVEIPLIGGQQQTSGTAVPSVLNNAIAEGDLFPAAFRNWTIFGYNGNDVRATTPINQAKLILPDLGDKLPPGYKMSDMQVFPFKAQSAEANWGGVDTKAWASVAQMSASRLGPSNIRTTIPLANSTANAVSRVSRSITRSHGIFGVVWADGSTQSVTDFMDMNGDRFPDVVSPGNIQYTNMTGGLGNTVSVDMGSPRNSVNDSTSFDSGGLASAGTVLTRPSGALSPSGGGGAPGSHNGHSEPSFGFGAGLAHANTGNELMDMNGDGLPDIVFNDGRVALNLGYGFGTPEPWGAGDVNAGSTVNANLNMGYSSSDGTASMAGGLTLGTAESSTASTYVDINGDGLPDKVTGGGTLSVRFNTGNGFSDPVTWPNAQDDLAKDKNYNLGGGAYFTFGFTVYLVRFVFSPGLDITTGRGRPEVAFRDMDGDGYVDHVQSSSDDRLNVAPNPIGRTNLLRSVSRPLGATIELDYERNGNTYDMPQSRWVLSTTRVFDGVKGDGVDTLFATYKYYDVTDQTQTKPSGKYDRNEREFLGYAAVTEEQRNVALNPNSSAPYRMTVRQYYNGNYYTKGLLKSERVLAGNRAPYTETLNGYVLYDVTANVVLPNLADADKLDTATLFPQLKRTDHRYYEGQSAAGKSTFVTYDYDTLGNVIRYSDYGDAGTEDDVVAEIGYSKCDSEAVYITGKPLSITVKNGSTLLRSRQADIDCTNGNITQVRQLLENALVAATDLRYYDNGNLLSVSGPANYKGLHLAVDYQYDDQVQTHIVRIHDSYGLTSKAAYNYKYGKVEATTDTNNNVTSMNYDQFGRVENVFGPYEQGSASPTIHFEYHPEADDKRVPYAVSRHLDRDANGGIKPNTIDTVLFTDGLKRVIQTKKSAAIHVSPMAGTQNVMTVSGRVLFDEMGRSVEQYYPVTEAGGSNETFNPTFDNIQPTRTAYDVLDRTTSTILPDKTVTSMQYGFGADRNGLTQFMTTVIDANGRKKESYRDVRDLITTVREYNAGASIQTSYVYDPLKQITQVIDDHGNVTRVRYDNLGRRTVIDNPDTGRTETVYDLAGNVLQKISANLKGQGKSVQYDYDYNRLIAINYPTFPANNVSYAYGQSGDAYNRAGRISTVVHAAGVEARYYGKLGETVKENFCRKSEHCRKGADADRPGALPGHTILDSAAKTNSQHDIEHDNDLAPLYVTLTQYDTFGRLQRLTYPDGEVLTYGYDAGGLVNSATGVKGRFTYPYLTRLDYDKFDQRVYLKLGNGVETTYTYRQDNRRLDALQSQLPNLKHYRFQNLAYRYDNVGNILGISNNSLMPEGQKGIGEEVGGPVTQTFVYDDLYRLTQASGEYRHDQEHLNRYRMGMVYDSIHNINHKEQTTETVEQDHGKPHVDVQEDLTYRYHYQYGASGLGGGSTHPHAPSDIGPYAFQYDANGNQIERRQREEETERQIIWDEDNRMACVHEYETDHGHTRPGLLPQTPRSCQSTSSSASRDGKSLKDGGHTPEVRFTYNDRGERVYKESHENVSFYLNPHYTEKSDDAYKHILIGTTRLVTKEVEDEKKEKEDDQYYYHPDHLGSSSYVTDHEGKLQEHLEYFPFGETWVEEEGSALPIKFQFTAKELDSETGLYYFGARYYDPRTSIWQSADPILDKYLDGKGGMGGAYNSFNIAMYGYGHQNPLNIIDPDGNEAFKLFSMAGRSYYFVTQNSSEDGFKAGFSSISSFTKVTGIGDRHQAYDAMLVDEAFKYSNVNPDETKALMLSESGGNDKKSKAAFASDPMQVMVPGDYTADKGKHLGITSSETSTPEKSIEKGTKWYSYKKGEEYNWRLKNIPANSAQGKLLNDPKLSKEPMRGFVGYKGWMQQQVKGAERAQSNYDNR